MNFDIKEFERLELKQKEEEFEANELRLLFPNIPKDERIVIKIRALTGAEFYKVSEMHKPNQFALMLIKALEEGNINEGAEAIKEALNKADQNPEYKFRIEVLVLGTVEPRFNHAQAVKLFQHFPVVAHRITERILELTGSGSELKKKKQDSDTSKTKRSK